MAGPVRSLGLLLSGNADDLSRGLGVESFLPQLRAQRPRASRLKGLPLGNPVGGEVPIVDQAILLEDLDAAAKAGRFGDCVIPLDRLLPNFPRVNVLPVVERRVRHGTRFNILVSQILAGQPSPAQGATSQLDSGEVVRPRLRVFNQQDKLIAIAEAVVPRTYQPIVVLEAEPRSNPA